MRQFVDHLPGQGQEPQLASSSRKSVMPTVPLPSMSGEPPGLVPQAARSARKSVMPTLPSQSTSDGQLAGNS